MISIRKVKTGVSTGSTLAPQFKVGAATSSPGRARSALTSITPSILGRRNAVMRRSQGAAQALANASWPSLELSIRYPGPASTRVTVRTIQGSSSTTRIRRSCTDRVYRTSLISTWIPQLPRREVAETEADSRTSQAECAEGVAKSR